MPSPGVSSSILQIPVHRVGITFENVIEEFVADLHVKHREG